MASCGARALVQRPVETAVGEHWSWLATIVLGLGLTMWIALEVVYLPQTSFLQIVYAAVGLVLLVLPLHPRLRADLAAHAPSRTKPAV